MVFQLDHGCGRLLHISRDRTAASFHTVFDRQAIDLTRRDGCVNCGPRARQAIVLLEYPRNGGSPTDLAEVARRMGDDVQHRREEV